jgi:hypothetical protein
MAPTGDRGDARHGVREGRSRLLDVPAGAVDQTLQAARLVWPMALCWLPISVFAKIHQLADRNTLGVFGHTNIKTKFMDGENIELEGAFGARSRKSD